MNFMRLSKEQQQKLDAMLDSKVKKGQFLVSSDVAQVLKKHLQGEHDQEDHDPTGGQGSSSEPDSTSDTSSADGDDFESKTRSVLSSHLSSDAADSFEMDGGEIDDDRVGSFEHDGEEWNIIADEDTAESVAYDRVKADLDDDPSMFDQDWLQSHVTMTPTDVRVIANDEADSIATDIDDDRAVEEAGLEYDFEEAANDDNTDRQSEIVQEARDKIRDDRYESVKDSLERDPIGYFVDDLGAYSREEIMKQPFIRIDTDSAAKEAVRSDGWAHFLSREDGDYNELPNGAVVYRGRKSYRRKMAKANGDKSPLDLARERAERLRARTRRNRDTEPAPEEDTENMSAIDRARARAEAIRGRTRKVKMSESELAESKRLAEDLKGKKDVDNPHALARWMVQQGKTGKVTKKKVYKHEGHPDQQVHNPHKGRARQSERRSLVSQVADRALSDPDVLESWTSTKERRELKPRELRSKVKERAGKDSLESLRQTMRRKKVNKHGDHDQSTHSPTGKPASSPAPSKVRARIAGEQAREVGRTVAPKTTERIAQRIRQSNVIPTMDRILDDVDAGSRLYGEIQEAKTAIQRWLKDRRNRKASRKMAKALGQVQKSLDTEINKGIGHSLETLAGALEFVADQEPNKEFSEQDEQKLETVIAELSGVVDYMEDVKEQEHFEE